jgi:putative ABC transport system substrate-binding protein
MPVAIGRRELIAALGGAAVWPLGARSIAEAQPATKMHRVGFLLGASGQSVASLFHALQEGLRDLGYVDGRNIVFVQRYVDGRMERLPDLAAELVPGIRAE